MIFNLSKTTLYGSTTLALSVVLGSTTALAAASACDDSFQYTCTDSYEKPPANLAAENIKNAAV